MFSKMVSPVTSILLLVGLATALPSSGMDRRQATTPDNTCGGTNKYTCNPNDSLGGACCSASGWCGKTDAYCGTGCQAAYSFNGKCSATTTPAPTPSFTHHQEWTFTGSTLPSGLGVSTWNVDADPGTPSVAHIFEARNVVVKDGYLQLIVPGGQSASSPPLRSAEVWTTVDNIKYASVKTTAILSEVAGVCNGMFFYQSDKAESDIEWLSDATSTSNNGKRWLHFTNQDENGNHPEGNTYTRVDPPSNPTTTEHEYRIDWLEGKTLYYVDGVLKATMTTDVPKVPGSWMWNNWANADPGWTGAPPKTDSIFKIKKIVMDYNTV